MHKHLHNYSWERLQEGKELVNILTPDANIVNKKATEVVKAIQRNHGYHSHHYQMRVQERSAEQSEKLFFSSQQTWTDFDQIALSWASRTGESGLGKQEEVSSNDVYMLLNSLMWCPDQYWSFPSFQPAQLTHVNSMTRTFHFMYHDGSQHFFKTKNVVSSIFSIVHFSM